MPKARRRKGTPFETSLSKSVFLYGEPTKKKTVSLEKMQAGFLALVNRDIQMLHTQPGITRQLVKNDKKDSLMRSLEKQMREKGVNSAFCQNAFDMAVTRLSSRLDAIQLEMHAQEQTIFTQSKALFAMSIDGAPVRPWRGRWNRSLKSRMISTRTAPRSSGPWRRANSRTPCCCSRTATRCAPWSSVSRN